MQIKYLLVQYSSHLHAKGVLKTLDLLETIIWTIL